MNANDPNNPITLPNGGTTLGDNFDPQYWRDLIDYARIAPEEPPLGDFGKMQVMNITHLLNQLSRIKAGMEHNQTLDARQMSLLRRTLHQYSKFPYTYFKRKY